MPYIGRTLGQGTRSRFLYTATAGQTTFSGSDTQSNTLAYADNNGLDCFQNGVLLKGGGADYTATSGTSVVLTTGASVNDVIEILVYDVFAIADHVKKSGDAMTGALTNIDVNGTELVLDADGDTSITADTDDRVDVKVGGSDMVHVTTTGLGVGTTSPSHELHITGSSDTRAIITSGGSGDAVMMFENASGNTWGHGLDLSSGNYVIGYNASGDPSLTSDGKVNIDTSGRLLVGTTSTSYNDQGGRLTGGNLQLTNSDGQLIRLNRTTATGNLIELWYNGGEKGSISTNGSNVSYNTSSDYRLKENVKTDWDATTRLKQLKPSQFNWKVDKDTTVDGFLAHEVSSIVPEAVTGEKDAVDKDGNPEYQGIDQSKLVPLLTKALQEAVAKIETLEAKVTALEGK